MVPSISLGCSCNSAVQCTTGRSVAWITNVRGSFRNFDNSRSLPQDFVIFSTSARGLRGNRTRSQQKRSPCTVLVRAVLAEPPSRRVDQLQAGHVQRDDLGVPVVASTSQSILQESMDQAATTASKPAMGLTESRLDSSLQDRFWVLVGISATSGMMLKAVEAVHSATGFGGLALGTMAAYLLADLGTGVYHWGVDNYGDAGTPVFGSQIDAFQGHHQRPWTITTREFCNNTQAIARPVGLCMLPLLLLPGNSTANAFLGVFWGLVIMSQQIHSWAHCKRSNVPAVVDFLQSRGILVSRKMHGAHHRSPYSINYCIVSGLWNPLLNKSKVFKRLESFIYSRWGILPRCWADSIPAEWLQEGSYFEDGTELKSD